MNPWHDVDLGEEVPDLVPTIIEVPKGSKTKYELDKPTGLIRVDRILYSSVNTRPVTGLFLEPISMIMILIIAVNAHDLEYAH